MRDINEPLRIAYTAALTQIANVPVFYQYLPNNLTPDNYIVFRSITSNDASTKGNFGVNLTVTVEIHTKGNLGNRGLSADTIADQVFQLIYPSKQDNLQLNRGQIIYTQIANDQVLDYAQRNQNGWISRYITFRHNINVDTSDASGGGGTVIAPGAVFRIDYTATGDESGFSDSRLQNKNIIDVSKDGVSCAEIITTGTPVDKQALYNTVTGSITFAQSLEVNEKIFVLYQLN